MDLDRRKLLELAGLSATVSLGTMAGCLDTVGLGEDGDGGNGTPAYARWLPWDEDTDETFVAYVDWSTLEEFEDFEPAPEPEDPEDGPDEDRFEHEDPMLEIPAFSVMIVALWGGFGLIGTGLSGLLATGDTETDGDVPDFESSLDEFVMVNGAFVLAGDIDTEEIHDALTESPEDGLGMKIEYERTDERNGFDIYEPAESDGEDDSLDVSMGQDNAIAVSDEAIVFANGGEETDAIDALGGPIEAYDGDRDRAIDRNDDLWWLLETAGHGHMAFGGYSDLDEEDDADLDESDEFEELANATGIVASLSIESESSSTGEFAAVFEELTEDTEAEIEDTFGASAEEVTHDIGDDRVSVSATWNQDVTDSEL